MPPSIVVQTQIRLRNSARTVAFRGAAAKIQIISFLSFFYVINYKLARTPWNHDTIFSIPLQFRDRGLSFNSNYTCLDEENYGRRNGFFFQFPIKGEREGRERSKKRAIEQQLATSCSSSRGSFFSGYQRTTRTYFNL